MTDPIPHEPRYITSALWKVGLLTLNAAYFPRLVQAAAEVEHVEYSQGLLVHVAAQKAVTDAIQVQLMPDGSASSVDESLAAFAVTNGADVDAVIRAGVRSYKPPTT